jgi:hypothetical protein
MKPTTQAEITSMKDRGFDPATIREEEARLDLYERGQVLAARIRAAFTGVTLGNGIGLVESRGRDQHESPAMLAAYRASDEKEDWTKIPSVEIDCSCGGLSFFDAEGMRFHLPAYLIADLNGEYGRGLAFHLTEEPGNRGRFDLLDAAQRACVRAYLSLLLEDPNEDHHRDEIQNALGGYWSSGEPHIAPRD